MTDNLAGKWLDPQRSFRFSVWFDAETEFLPGLLQAFDVDYAKHEIVITTWDSPELVDVHTEVHKLLNYKGCPTMTIRFTEQGGNVTSSRGYCIMKVRNHRFSFDAADPHPARHKLYFTFDPDNLLLDGKPWPAKKGIVHEQ